MCFDLDSQPPIRSVAGGSLDHEDLVLTASDGTRFAAFRARAAEPSGAGIVILPDVRGLYAFYEELALRFAEAGIDAIAFDFFGRTAGVSKRDADFPYMDYVPLTKMAELELDVTAAVEELRRDGRVKTTFSVGFCFGGRLSLAASSFGLGLAGSIAFYGMPTTDPARYPDPFGMAAKIAAFSAALTAAKVDHEFITYPDAPHSFFDRKAAEFADASTDAWTRSLAFIAART